MVDRSPDVLKKFMGSPLVSGGGGVAPKPRDPFEYTPINYSPIQAPSTSNITSLLLQSQEKALKSYIQNIGKYGSTARDMIFQAIPELGDISRYYEERLAEPIPEDLLADYRGNLRTAMESRGWDIYATSPQIMTEEAKYLTKIQEQARAALAPQISAFGTSLLGLSGFTGPSQISFPELATSMLNASQMAAQQQQFQQQFYLMQSQYQAELEAARQRSLFAQQEFGATQKMIDAFLKGTGQFSQYPTGASMAEMFPSALDRSNFMRQLAMNQYGSAMFASLAPAWSPFRPPTQAVSGQLGGGY